MLLMLSKAEFNNTVFWIGIVKNTDLDLFIKVGITKDLCNQSRVLELKKPALGMDHYKTIGHYQQRIINDLERNNYQNLGSGTVDNVLYYMNHRFTLFLPRIPITRLP
jgi:hypothetical protein